MQDGQDAENAHHTTYRPLEANNKQTWRKCRQPKTPCTTACCCSMAPRLLLCVPRGGGSCRISPAFCGGATEGAD